MTQTDNHTISENKSRPLIPELKSLACDLLGRMFIPQKRFFAFRLKRKQNSDVLEGTSRRYTATVLIGLANENDDITRPIFGETDKFEICDKLISEISETDEMSEPGEIALTLWAARVNEHQKSERVLKKLIAIKPTFGNYWRTVELSWALSALSVNSSQPTDATLADNIARRLLNSFNTESHLFPHWPVGSTSQFLRKHVLCFADIVYPIQALSFYSKTFSNPRALEVANLCAKRMCQLQGQNGQWFWHYDVRTSKVIEKYPVYSVHQDSMAPMALIALKQAGGEDFSHAIEKSLDWLIEPPEPISNPIIDKKEKIIWRKVYRREPGKFVRAVNAIFSRLHPDIRLPAADIFFKPNKIDYESRPYHMGWILSAWQGQ